MSAGCQEQSSKRFALPKSGSFEKRVVSLGAFTCIQLMHLKQLVLVRMDGETDVPSLESLTKEDAIEVQDARELRVGLAWFANELRAFFQFGKRWSWLIQAHPGQADP